MIVFEMLIDHCLMQRTVHALMGDAIYRLDIVMKEKIARRNLELAKQSDSHIVYESLIRKQVAIVAQNEIEEIKISRSIAYAMLDGQIKSEIKDHYVECLVA